MSEIQRYDLEQESGGWELACAHMKPEPDGDYVKHADHLAELVRQLEEAQDKLHRILDWCEAYPIECFTPPDLEADRKLLGDTEFTRLNAHSMRHVVTGIANIIKDKDALEGREIAELEEEIAEIQKAIQSWDYATDAVLNRTLDRLRVILAEKKRGMK